jgi:hypothetical protein
MTDRQHARIETQAEVARVAEQPDPSPAQDWTWNATMYQEGDGVDYPSDLGLPEGTLRTLVERHAPKA